MHIDTPLTLYTGRVRPEWIDYNGHMNVASYVQAFDHATDALLDLIGLDADYRTRYQCSAFVVETHVNYQRELLEHAPLRITTQLLGFDAKRIHYFHRMYHADKGWLSATSELLVVHVDLHRRHGASMPRDVMDRLAAIHAQHLQLRRPPQSGRVMGVAAHAPAGD